MKPYFLCADNILGDATEEIEKRLSEYGACELGPGLYKVRGIKMPDGSSLYGVGNATKILLDPEISDGAAIILGSFCAVRNLNIIGSEEKIALPQRVEKRHGILFAGDAHETKAHAYQHKHIIIDCCHINSFSGGGITCNNTGYSPRSSITATNCHIFNCGAGINIPYFSEYHEFTNILSTENLFGCINNGGNNVFTNCGFNCNVTGFVIDNSDGKANNQSHGSAVGCTFNHSNANEGVGIFVSGANWGYVFSSCQLFYSKVIVENSKNIVFNAFNIGRVHEFDIKGGSLTLLSNCAFPESVVINVTDNESVKVKNCFTVNGDEVNL